MRTAVPDNPIFVGDLTPVGHSTLNDLDRCLGHRALDAGCEPAGIESADDSRYPLACPRSIFFHRNSSMHRRSVHER